MRTTNWKGCCVPCALILMEKTGVNVNVKHHSWHRGWSVRGCLTRCAIELTGRQHSSDNVAKTSLEKPRVLVKPSDIVRGRKQMVCCWVIVGTTRSIETTRSLTQTPAPQQWKPRPCACLFEYRGKHVVVVADAPRKNRRRYITRYSGARAWSNRRFPSLSERFTSSCGEVPNTIRKHL